MNWWFTTTFVKSFIICLSAFPQPSHTCLSSKGTITRHLSVTTALLSADTQEKDQEEKNEVEEEYHSIIKDTERGKGMHAFSTRTGVLASLYVNTTLTVRSR